MKQLLALLTTIFVASCSTPKDSLQVQQYHLRESMFQENNDPMVRGEVQRRLHGAITLAERREKIGQYYTVSYCRSREESQANAAPVKIIFEYQQAVTASAIKRMEKSVSCTDEQEVEFAVVGEDYAKNGRVLTWRVRVMEGEQVLAEKRSYLWR